VTADEGRRVLVRRGFALEYLTLGWNVAGIVVLGLAAFAARSVALAGFGLDSLIEIGASTVADGARTHDRRTMRTTAQCTERASCTDATDHRTDGNHRAGII